MRVLQSLLCYAAAGTAAGATAADAPTIHWVSEPLVPGDTAQIAFVMPAKETSQNHTTNITFQASHNKGGWVALDTQGVTEYGGTATIPDTFPAQVRREQVAMKPLSKNIGMLCFMLYGTDPERPFKSR